MKEASIFINQIGYRPQDSKIAYVTSDEKGSATQFTVVNQQTGKVVYTGDLCATPEDAAVGEPIFTGDFSSVTAAGEYHVCVNGKDSFSFKIADKIYDDVYYSALNYFTEARCGQGVCHTGKAEVYGTKEIVDVQGGWHDAGDYGRYVIAGTKTIMDLLLGFELKNLEYSRFDILAEVRFELEWLLQMQREDGGVYHKISGYHFCGFIMPEEEKDQMVLAPVSTSATADFAGCLAYAAKYFKETDKKFADTLLKAAVKAQNYLFAHEDELYINPPEITTGGYGDRDVSDERYFALCSLFAATGDENYLNHALKIKEDKKAEKPDPEKPWAAGWREGFGWPFVTGYGTEILLQNESMISNPAVIEEIKNGIIAQAEKTLEFAKKAAFNYCLKFVMWGSNGAICDVAHVLVMAYKLTGRKEFMQIAKAQIDYILGCNPVNYCYITGAGSKSPVNPHHRPSGAKGIVYKGMLAGGPCAGLHDEYAKKHLQGMAPLKCYADAMPSYSTNEVAIYWNSAFVYLLSSF